MPYSVWPSAATRAAPGQTSIVVLPGAGALALAGGSVTAVANGLPFSTSFPVVENPLSQGGIWLGGFTTGLDWQNGQVTANGAFAASATVNDYDDGTALLNPAVFTFTSNQYVEGTVYRDPTFTTAVVPGYELELRIRSSLSAHSCTGYELYCSLDNGLTLVRWNGARGDFSPILDGGTYVATTGDVLRIEAVGSTLTIYVNGVSKGSISDGTFLTGTPGMGWGPYPGVSGADLLRMGWSSFRAGTL